MKTAKAARMSPASNERVRKQVIAEIQKRIDTPADAADVAPGGEGAIEGEVTAKAGSPRPPAPHAQTSGGKGKKAKAAKAPKAEKPVKAAKPAKAPKPDKPKRLSCINAAAQVLAKNKEPMKAKEMIEAMAKQGLWSSPKGETPEASLYAAIIREIAAKGNESRFVKTDRGSFAAAPHAGKGR